MKNEKKENVKKDELLDEYYAQVENGDDTHTHVDYSDSYGDSSCCC